MSSLAYANPANSIINSDELEAELSASLDGYAAAYRHAELPRASLELKQVKQLQQERSELQTLCQRFSQQLIELEREHETAQLQLNFEPLLQRLELYGEILNICGQMSDLAKRFETEHNEVKEACLALAKQIFPYHLPKFEQGLEMFQDRCDSVADQLDALESKGHEISPLIRSYEIWIALVERFAEILDERTEALRPAS